MLIVEVVPGFVISYPWIVVYDEVFSRRENGVSDCGRYAVPGGKMKRKYCTLSPPH